MEYRSTYKDEAQTHYVKTKVAREFVTPCWVVYFMILRGIINPRFTDWVVLVLAIFGVIAFRVHKRYPMFDKAWIRSPRTPDN